MNPARKPTVKKVEDWNLVEWIAFAAFVIWSAAGLIFTVGHITPDVVAHWNLPPDLVSFVQLCLASGDPILILLAFTNTHLHAARQWTPSVARNWALLIVLASYAVEALGARTGFPFGTYSYTDQFGPRIWLVPVTIPLAWHVVVTNALFIVRVVAPYLSRILEAVIAGAICTAYDFVLEPFATIVKHYWVWAKGDVPILNYAAWLVVSALLIYFLAPTHSLRFRRDLRPWLILLITLAIFLAGEMTR
jgi:uncharacterized membrane protein